MLSGDVDFAETKKTVVYYSTMTTGEPSKITNNPETGWAVAPNTGIPNNATYNKTVVTGNGKYASADVYKRQVGFFKATDEKTNYLPAGSETINNYE